MSKLGLLCLIRKWVWPRISPSAGSEVVVQYARGPLWLLRVVAPAVLALLVTFPVAVRLGLLKV